MDKSNNNILETIKLVAKSFSIADLEKYDFFSRSEIIEKIKEKNEQTAFVLKEFLYESGMFQLIKHDMEMKIKAPEIWEEQVEYRKEKLSLIAEELLYEIPYCSEDLKEAILRMS